MYEYLVKAAKSLDLPHVTPHGFRSFYVTKRRSDGATDEHAHARHPFR